MTDKRDLRDKVASLFELPADVLMDCARLTLIGARELMVENHRGLYEYTTDKVVLSVPEGRLTVIGQDLGIRSISPDQLTLHGSIRGIHYGD
ncbi:MAG TPA: sporulation protein YqfC [Symbiobacteriaceae bacterium]|nr:sporulation protein YqfC [Symbiobacteriaceae bacterium]